MRQIPIYWINLASRPERKTFMEEQFDRLKLKAERIEAVTRDDLTPEQIDKYCNPNRRWSMSRSRYACNLSHMKAWRTLLASGEKRALILEDDAVLSNELPAFLDGAAALGYDPHIIRIEKYWDNRHHWYGPAEREVSPGIVLRKCITADAGSAGYLITPIAAERLLAEPAAHRIYVDNLLFTYGSPLGRWLGVRASDPALCRQLVHQPGEVARTSLNHTPEDDGHKQATRLRPLVKFSRHAEVWFLRDIPFWLIERVNRLVLRATWDRLSFRE